MHVGGKTREAWTTAGHRTVTDDGAPGGGPVVPCGPESSHRNTSGTAVDGAARGVPVCDLVTVPARHGLEAVDILRLRDGVGPVLHDGPGGTLGFLVPSGTAEGWDLPGSNCIRTGRPADRREPPVAGAGWLIPPDDRHRTPVDPSALRAALAEATRTIEAADRTV